jgi:enterochelin esterase family protein
MRCDCLAQNASDFKPVTSNVLDAQYPRVDSNSQVEIRFKAPDASKARVNFWRKPRRPSSLRSAR